MADDPSEAEPAEERAAVSGRPRTAPSSRGAHAINFAAFAPRLSAIAAGQTNKPDTAGAYDRQMGQAMASQAATMGMTAGEAAISGVLSGGSSLLTSIPHMAMQGVAAGQMASTGAQVSADMRRAQAERAANQLIPDADRPPEAQAILSVIRKAYGSSAAWQNPQTGSSGKVTIRPVAKGAFKGLECRLVQREWRGGGKSRRGDMIACQSGGEWYDLS
ncbi:hypothetical protein ILT44_02555 [Microvirga sp. BT689]|uniref:hypothetical protein n=1 Tax=Microvirga arvi TaxID=2778731 RepID=UPI00194E11CA|nr:hypothetical protein [Microvirga arvi]MBM6579051.1 hypothetical protein [Microvirga arvi]